MTNGDSAIAVSAGGLSHGFEKASLRSDLGQTAVVGNSHTSTTVCGRLIALYSHVYSLLILVLREGLLPIHTPGLMSYRGFCRNVRLLSVAGSDSYQIMPSKKAMVLEPSASVTIAFFQLGVLPSFLPILR